MSVGFRPLEQPTPITNAEGRTTGYLFTKQELLETSCVNLPANINALQRAIDDKIILAPDVEKFFLRGGTRNAPDSLLAPADPNDPATLEGCVDLLESYQRLYESIDRRPQLAPVMPSVKELGVSMLGLVDSVRSQHQVRSIAELERLLRLQ